jgi:glutamate-5-semialdehyde dehydrogenase
MNAALLEEKAREARKASLELEHVQRAVKDMALKSAAEAIAEHRCEILRANKKDIERNAPLLREGRLSKPLLNRLKLDGVKIHEMCKMIEKVAELDDPVGRTLYSVRLDEGLDLYKVTVPFGVIAAIFESRPDALAQISALCIKSGNSVILKGGEEAKESNRCLFEVIYNALVGAGLPAGCMQLVEGREAVGGLLRMEKLVDLIIPRGSNEFVKFVQSNTRIPVLGHSAGICHIYVDSKADPKKAVEICYDAKVQYPAACNSMKVLLIHKRIASELLPKIVGRLLLGGVRIKGCNKAVRILRSSGLPAEEAVEGDWSTEYLDLTLPVKVVDGVDEAIEHINAYGSKHTDSVITEDAATAQRFMRMVDSATVVHNASTRFSDGYRYGLGAEVGISTNKVHARGPVGLEGLVTTKYMLFGTGQKVSDYVGKRAKPFVHGKPSRTLNEIMA